MYTYTYIHTHEQIVRGLRNTNHAVKAASMQLVRTLCTLPEGLKNVYNLEVHGDIIAILSYKDDDNMVLNAIGCLTMFCKEVRLCKSSQTCICMYI
jgi:hypothetical protein